MRIAGLLALGLMLAGCAKSVDDWRRDLKDPDPYARQMAAVALGRTGREDAAPDLLAALSDYSETVRAAALDGLRALGPQAVPALLSRLELGEARADGSTSDARLVASVLVDQGLTSMAPLVRALQDPRYDREAIVEALSDAGPSVVDPLSELLLQPQPSVAAAAATALGSLGERALPAVSRLVLALRRTEPEVIAAAAGALGRIAPDRNDVLPALLQVARAPDGEGGPDAPLASAHAAARAAAVRGLLLRMAGGEASLQEQSLAEMAALGPLAVEGLIHALKFEEEPVASEAASCLAALGPDVLPHVIGSLGERNPTHVARGALVVSRLGPPALAPLLAIIGEPGHRDRVRATTALAGLGAGADPAWPVLLALLDDSQPQLALAAALTLSKLTPPDEASLDALVAAHRRSSAMVGRLLVPALVRGLLPRTEPGATQAAARLTQLRELGLDGRTELERLRAGDDPALAAAAGRAAALLSSP
jgi:HEAT repeat protein